MATTALSLHSRLPRSIMEAQTYGKKERENVSRDSEA